MDGNRRYAKMKRMERSLGHVLGFDKLAGTLDWCLNLGIEEVTVYAFSIENFRRSKDEVEGLMDLAKRKFEKLLNEKDVLMKHGVRVRVLGDLSMLPTEVAAPVARAVNLTKDNTNTKLNVCLAYTSRYEFVEATKRVSWGVEEGLIKPSDVTEELFERCLYTEDSPPCDLLVRTSGEVRLSDFLLWQSSYSCLCFQDVLWPEYSLWDLASAVLSYQRNYHSLQAARSDYYKERTQRVYESDRKCVVEQLNNAQRIQDQDGGDEQISKEELEALVLEYRTKREERSRDFLQRLRKRNQDFLDSLCSQVS
jgi:ditrans,polycis-polyprenyl diphosphate synthase